MIEKEKAQPAEGVRQWGMFTFFLEKGATYLTNNKKGGWDRRQVACFQTGSVVRNKEIFAGADLDLGRRKKADENSST